MSITWFSLMLSENSSRFIPWWGWLILILILLLLLWLWFGREEEDVAAKVSTDGAAAPSNDLKKIEGIGPKVERLLNEAGITTYAQLADADLNKLVDILENARLQMIDPTTWAEQARLADEGDWDSLHKLQEELKGGRR